MGPILKSCVLPEEDETLGIHPATPTLAKSLDSNLLQSPPVNAATMYERLSIQPGEFRVFQLDPSHDPSAPVVVHLFTAPLDSPPQYDALSYRWSGSTHHTINVNGANLPVTENLFLALQSLRKTSGVLPLTLWVDSICINQASIPERNQQVPLMGEIYTQAQTVRIWLGDEEPGVEAAFDLVHDCGNSGSSDIVARVIGDEVGTRALTQLLHRPYWGRMWMFQEVVLAPSAVVHCGSYEAPWAYFKWLDDVTADVRLWLDLQVEHTWILDLREAMFRITHFGIPKEKAQDVNAVLVPTRQLQCQDPRDKIYALIGVCGTLAKDVVVDYAVSTRDVYTAFTKSRIESDQELYMLLSAGMWDPANGEDLQLPSWVPDLRGTAGFDTRYLGGAYLEVLDADKNGAQSFAFSEQDGQEILEIESLLYDTVQACADFAISDENNRKALVDMFCQEVDGEDLSVPKLRSFFQAVVFEDAKSGQDKERMQRLILGFFEDLRNLYGYQPILTGFLQSFEDMGLHLLQHNDCDPLQLFSSEELHHNRLEYLRRAGQNSQDDRDSAVFSTAHGYFGLGSSRLIHGDTIAVIRGCRVPMVLRKAGDYFRLVCPSYVSGLMQGEAVKISGGTSNFERVQLI